VLRASWNDPDIEFIAVAQWRDHRGNDSCEWSFHDFAWMEVRCGI
jgi:hypothetical protein